MTSKSPAAPCSLCRKPRHATTVNDQTWYWCADCDGYQP